MQLKAQNLTIFDCKTNRFILNNVTFEQEFQSCGFFGTSGSGKSTLMKILCGLPLHNLEVTGDFYLEHNGRPFKFEFGRNVACILQNAQNCFDPNLTMEKQFMRTFQNLGWTKSESYDKTQQILDKCQLDARVLSLYPDELSGGMLQRCALGIAIMLQPLVLIADEPTSSLDQKNQKMIIDMMQELQENGTTLLLTSHKLQEIEQLCDSILILHKGQLTNITVKEMNQHTYVRQIKIAKKILKHDKMITAQEKSPLIEVQHLNQSYQKGWFNKPVAILQDLNFTIQQGENIAIMGPSGVGKTTLLRLLTKQLRPTTGKVKYLTEHLKMSIVFQNAFTSLDPTYSVAQIFREVMDEYDELKVAHICHEVGLSAQVLKQSFRHLSGGELQRLCLARAIAYQPNILILDEAFSGLDLQTTVDILQVLTQLQQKYHLTYIVVTHNFDLAKYLCPRLIYLENKKVSYDGLTKSFIAKTEN